MVITFLLFGSDGNFEALDFLELYAYTRPQSIQKQIVECDIKSTYPEEYSTVDKVGRERLLARKSCLCVELIASSFLI